MVELKKFFSLIMRNTKCYFKDKVSFFMSLITPLILLFLFMTFLRNVYIEIFESAFPEGFSVDKKIVNGIAGAWLMSSILGVSSVTVAFCSNLVMVDDKIQSCINDFKVSPVKPTTISFAYFASNFFVTFIVMMCAMLIGHIYLGAVGWYITASDVHCLRALLKVLYLRRVQCRLLQLSYRPCTVLSAVHICRFRVSQRACRMCLRSCRELTALV